MFHYDSHLTHCSKLGCVGARSIVKIKIRCHHPKATFRLVTTMSDTSRPHFLAQTKRDKIQSLRDTISFKQPVVFGTSTFPADQWTLFYGEKGQLG
jgi:hypothetical protein